MEGNFRTFSIRGLLVKIENVIKLTRLNMEVEIECALQLKEIEDMILKTRSLSESIKIPIFRKIALKCFNKLDLNGNTLDVKSIHFKNNNMLLQKDNYFSCGKDSFLQHGMVHVEGINNSIVIADNAELYGINIRIFGDGNQVIVGNESIIRNSNIMIRGNYNKIFIGEKFSSYNATFHLEDDGNEVCIGTGTTLHGREHRAVNFELCEGCKIIVGNDCMFSNDIQIRPSDAHSVVDLNRKRLNPAEDIVIGNHCWICLGVTILKGVRISDHTVVGAGSLCTKKYTESHCVLAGNPAKVVKRQIDWDRKFL